MEQRTATIPFDLETAKKINIGEIAGRIVTEKGQNRAEIVYEDNSSSCPLLVVIHSISVSADWFSATGKALSSENRLLLEVPEYIIPVSTWERSYRYKGYGYNMCRETKKKLLQAIKGVNVEEEDVSLYTTGGWD